MDPRDHYKDFNECRGFLQRASGSSLSDPAHRQALAPLKFAREALDHLRGSWRKLGSKTDYEFLAEVRAHWYKAAVLDMAGDLWRAVYQVEHVELGRRTNKDSGERTADHIKFLFLGQVWFEERV